DAVQTAKSVDGLVDERVAHLRLTHVTDDYVRLATLELDEARRLLGRGLVDVGARHRRTFAGGQRGDRPPIAGRRVLLRRRPRSGADDQDSAVGQSDHSAYRSRRPRAITRPW